MKKEKKKTHVNTETNEKCNFYCNFFYGIPHKAIFIICISTYKLYKNLNNSLLRSMKRQKSHLSTKEKEGWLNLKFYAGPIFLK